MNFKGITAGTYISRKPKNPKEKNVCANCEIKKKCAKKHITKDKEYELCKNCEKCYVSKSCKAIITTGIDRTTGKTMKKTFVAESEDIAVSKALEYKIQLEKDGGPRIITKSNKTLIDLVQSQIDENFKLNNIKENTYKRKMDTLKKLNKETFARKPISKVVRIDIVNYYSKIKKYSNSTIKQIHELICIGFAEAYHQGIIKQNFMDGYKKIGKPKSEYESKTRKALTIEEQKKFVNYLNEVDYSKCKHKDLFLLLISTGMRIGEALTLDYTKDIDLKNETITIRRTQTRDIDGKSKIGNTTKTFSGERVINLNEISKKALEEIMKHIKLNKFHLLFYNPVNTKYGIYEEASINSALKRIGLKLKIGIYEEENSKGKKVIKTDLHTHMLRGTFATRCAEAKIAPIVLQKILGHSDISITMKYYIDIDTDFIESENKNIVNYLQTKKIFGT